MKEGELASSARRAERSDKVKFNARMDKVKKVKAVEVPEEQSVALACPGYVAIQKTRKPGRRGAALAEEK